MHPWAVDVEFHETREALEAVVTLPRDVAAASVDVSVEEQRLRLVTRGRTAEVALPASVRRVNERVERSPGRLVVHMEKVRELRPP